ncbi:ergothioneine biosynthesis protein EgtC [Arthrobacter echini]|uniref:Gamma-glutamyl-hercynylcysteine sulfoxide hydrolase n=1 Tax=Arthrobacter echini TaxID=1529066 RepID=A0A4S5E686_9MICC|nr:ergothioneine biosynthesis protein EgtC [Arthrobacter echini]THJ67061.1 ergothioneine biosynthesis protein EgtC [Arthrobacter echini]
MCRHLAFLGPPTPLATLISAPDHGLLRQSWSPRLQRNGTMNADGFGVGWYAADDPLPARYRRAVPMWTDQSFADVARVTSSGAVLAAVRSATTGTTPDEAAAAPYTSGKWLFSHNGRIDDWPRSAEDLAATLPPARLLALEARVDSALLWALVLHRLDSLDSAADALAHVVTAATAASTGRYNFLLTDGDTIAATTAGDTLFWRSDARGTVVASEPSDDDADWHEVPDRSLLVATPHAVDISPIHPAETEAPPG